MCCFLGCFGHLTLNHILAVTICRQLFWSRRKFDESPESLRLISYSIPLCATAAAADFGFCCCCCLVTNSTFARLMAWALNWQFVHDTRRRRRRPGRRSSNRRGIRRSRWLGFDWNAGSRCQRPFAYLDFSIRSLQTTRDVVFQSEAMVWNWNAARTNTLTAVQPD